MKKPLLNFGETVKPFPTVAICKGCNCEITQPLEILAGFCDACLLDKDNEKDIEI